jgi:branched-chain amino acid aminotransferase
MKMLADVERDWVPTREGTSLYLRPTMIAHGSELGVHPAHKYLYYIICSPAGSYYKNGMSPIKIHIEDSYVRAVKGGTGAAKTGGNYSASLKAAHEASKQGFDQVLWLDGKQNKYVEEVGAMNMMFIIDHKLYTAPTGGSILPGITRKSVLRLAEDMGIEVYERPVSVMELYEAYSKGTLQEAFGTGTAAVISPVGLMEYRGDIIKLSDGEIGPIAMAIYNKLTGIQRGTEPDLYNWIEKIN